MYVTRFNLASAFFVVCKGRNDVAGLEQRWYESIIALSNIDDAERIFFVQAGYCSVLSNHKHFPGLPPAFQYRYGILVMPSPVLCAEGIFSSVLTPYPACCAQNLCCGSQWPKPPPSLGVSACLMPLCHLHLGHHSGSIWAQPDLLLLSPTPPLPLGFSVLQIFSEMMF